MKKIINNLKYIKLSDFLAPFIFLIVLPFSLIFKILNKVKNKQIWLITEEGLHARDNGYHLFKYIRTNYKECNCYYVIDKDSLDFSKVEKYGNIIDFKSLKHWFYYLAANYNISSQKNGNPNQVFFYFIHVVLGLFNNRIFLQHGVIKDLCDWLLYKNTKFRIFVCGAKKEYEYVKNNYGYPEDYVQYLGLARFDSLHNVKIDGNKILVMPTWRNWLGREVNSLSKENDFLTTDFFNYWNSFLTSKELIDFLEANGLELYFYPHVNMQKYIKHFNINSNRIIVCDLSFDIQEMLKSSSLLITDYSSVFMDFAYMRKPIIYYQFDYNEFRNKQYSESYFSYENDGFGPVVYDEDNLIQTLKEYKSSDFTVDNEYLERMDNFFVLYDSNNCERHYQLIKKLK